MILQVNRVAFPIQTLGYGQRVVVWTQGCSIRCAGCITASTWHKDPTLAIDTSALVDGMCDWWSTADGLTVSGGEPLDQPTALREFLRLARARVNGDILLYSGYSRERIDRDWPWVFDSVDVLITEPFVTELRPGPPLRGSSNQRLHRLSELATARYLAELDAMPTVGDPGLIQAIQTDGSWFVAGVPAHDLVGSLKRALRSVGYDLGETN